MKKGLSLVLAAAMVMATLSACGGNKDAAPADNATAVDQQTADQGAPADGTEGARQLLQMMKSS